MKDSETFDAAPYDLQIIDEGNRRVIQVKGDAGGSYHWDGADLGAVYERGSGGMMLEPAESRFPVDLKITSLGEPSATYIDSDETVILSEAQQELALQMINEDEDWMQSMYDSLQDSAY